MYRDIDLTFAPHPVTGDVSVRTGTMALLQSVRNIVLTSEWDVPFESDGWGDISEMLGEAVHPLVAVDVQDRVHQAIKNKEPRVEVVEVKALAHEDKHGFDVHIKFYEVNVPVENEMVVKLRRLK